MSSITLSSLFIASLLFANVDLRPSPSHNTQVSLICIRQLGLSNQEVEDIAEKMSRARVPENGEKFLQFLECFWKGRGFMDVHGEIAVDNLRNCLVGSFQDTEELTTSSNSLAQIVVANCKGISADNLGLKAAKVQNCVTNYLIDMRGSSNNQ